MSPLKIILVPFLLEAISATSALNLQGREKLRKLNASDLKSVLSELEQKVAQVNSTLLSNDGKQQLILDVNAETPEGFNCSVEVVNEEKIEYIDEERCYHKPSQLCYMTKSVKFVPTEKKVCQTHFIEKCHITYTPRVDVRPIRTCKNKQVYKCGLTQLGKADSRPKKSNCKFEYKTVCNTEYVTKNITENHAECTDVIVNMIIDEETTIQVPKKNCSLVPLVMEKTFHLPSCKQIKMEICTHPKDCDWVKEHICQDENHSFVVNVPDQKCDLAPNEECHTVSEYVPNLDTTQDCKEVSFEDCTLQPSLPVSIRKDKLVKRCIQIQEPTDSIMTQSAPRSKVLILFGYQDEKPTTKVEVVDLAEGRNCSGYLLPTLPQDMNYGIGAWSPSASRVIVCGQQKAPSMTCFSWAPQDTKWQLFGDIPETFNPVDLIEVNGKMILKGGLKSNKTYIIDIANDQIVSGPKLPQPLYGHCSVPWNESTILMIGGSDGDLGLLYNSTYFFNVETGDYLQGPSLNIGRAFFGCGILKTSQGKQFAIATGGYNQNSTEVLELGNFEDGWKMGPPLPNPNYGMKLESFGTSVFITGGVLEPRAVYELSCANDPTCSWVKKPNLELKHDRFGHVSIALPDDYVSCQ